MNIPRTTMLEHKEQTLPFGDGLNKNPLPRREYRYEPADTDGTLYRVNVTSSFLSPPHHKR